MSHQYVGKIVKGILVMPILITNKQWTPPDHCLQSTSHILVLVSHGNGGRSTLYVTGACSQLVKLQYVQRGCSMDAILALLRMEKIVEGFKLALFSEGRINVTEVFC